MRPRLIKRLALCMILATASSWSNPLQAEEYPSKAIRWVVAYPPGSTIDITARKLAPIVAAKMGVSIAIDNRPGASGVVGAAEVAKSPANGYTLLYTLGDPLIASSVMVETSLYDPLKDFTFITKILASSGLLLIVNPASTAKSVKEFLSEASRGRVTYGSYGPGSFPQIIMEQLALEANVKFVEVPYRGPPQAIQDLIGNQISATFASIINTRLAAKSGVIPIATIAKVRSAAFPDVPTLVELGFTSDVLQTPIWSGLIGPAMLPSEVIKKNVEAIHAALREPSMIKFAEEIGNNILIMPSETFSSEFKAEYMAVTALLRKLGLALR